MSLFSRKKKEPPTRTVSVQMQDGTVENYPESFMITDGINCVICMGKYYHTNLDCENLQWEVKNSSSPIKGMYIKDAKKQKITFCANCSRIKYLYEHDRMEEIQ